MWLIMLVINVIRILDISTDNHFLAIFFNLFQNSSGILILILRNFLATNTIFPPKEIWRLIFCCLFIVLPLAVYVLIASPIEVLVIVFIRLFILIFVFLIPARNVSLCIFSSRKKAPKKVLINEVVLNSHSMWNAHLSIFTLVYILKIYFLALIRFFIEYIVL